MNKTYDLYFAAFLTSSGMALSKAVREGKRVAFVFDDVSAEEWEESKTAYFNGDAAVKALAYGFAIRSLKSLVHVT